MISDFEVWDYLSFEEIEQGYQGELHNGLHNLQVLLEQNVSIFFNRLKTKNIRWIKN